MDPEVSILVRCPAGGLARGQVQAEVSGAYGRRALPGEGAVLAALWAAAREGRPRLFDAPKFRLGGAGLGPGGTPPLRLRLGLTRYRDFVGTNLAARGPRLRARGRGRGDPQAFLADPLGVGALLATADGRLVLLRRSHHVAEAPGKLDVPGGHPEPQAVAGGVPTASLRCEDLPPDLVVEEIFASVIKEIRDEVNLPPETLSPPRLLGLVRNETTAGRATAAFFVRCSLTAEETRERYEAGGAEAHESTAIVFVQAEELLGPGGPWAELCPSAKGAVTLYHEVGALL